MAQTSTDLTFTTLLERAVSEPGLISKAYSAFHGYSIGNQLLALCQCMGRELVPGPIATFMGWKAKGRSVRKGEKALVLCMPVTGTRRPTDTDDPDATAQAFTRFVYKPHWFVLSQTDGAALTLESVPTWCTGQALEALGLPGAEYCRGYIQHWNSARGSAPIPERSAQRIFKAADTILRAGRVDVDTDSLAA